MGGWATARIPRSMLLVLETDNEPRVRDGYIRLSTRGHARTLETRREGPICRGNVAASARPCPPVPPQNLHGKEEVDGSSPSEGSAKVQHVGALAFSPTCTVCSVRWVWSRLLKLSRSERHRAEARLADQFRDCRRQLQDARATTDAGLADQLANWSRSLLLHAFKQ